MGRAGDLLRAKKAQKTITFTWEQLEEHDKAVRSAYKEQLCKEVGTEYDRRWKKHESELWEAVESEWEDRRKEFFTDDEVDNMNAYLQYMLAASIKVLCDDFGWAKAKKGKWSTWLRVCRFAEAVANVMVDISNDDKKDIRQFAADVYDEYGVKYYYG